MKQQSERPGRGGHPDQATKQYIQPIEGYHINPAPVNPPVALAVRKHGRRCIVAKIVPLAGEAVLAVVWRRQRGTKHAISMPVAVLAFARQAGCRRFVLRDDRRQVAYTAPLDVFDRGRLVGQERYIPLSWLQPTAWRDWPYATEIVDLDLTPRPEVTLPLFDEVLP